jgi:hypothetical protein
MNDGVLQVNVRGLLEFFDEKVDGSQKHATAIVSVCGEDLGCGLLKHYFEARDASVEVRPEPCTRGKQKGPRLDRWIRVTGTSELGAMDVLLQVEVKNWSAHAIGGRKLRLDAPPEEVADYKRERWAKEWSDKGISTPALRKVIERMRPPDKLAYLPVEPLACMWTALHPTGDVEPLFSVSLPQAKRTESDRFDRVWFFSMSSYLRSLTDERIPVHMPDATKRIGWLDQLFRS